MTKIFLCSFASSDLDLSVSRFQKQADSFDLYSQVKIFRPDDLPKKIINRIKNFEYPVQKLRLFGYGCWKPYIVEKYFKTLPKNSVLQYSDIGFHINKNGIQKLKKYYDICFKRGALVFQYRKPRFDKFAHYKFQEYYEHEYTKADLFKYLKVNNNDKIINTPQILSGSFFLKKNVSNNNFLLQWLKASSFDHLIDDSKSKEINHIKFKEHRHDQSIFSILSKKKNFYSVSASECEWAEINETKSWQHISNNPILAKRDKKFNFIKRFYIRQKKNISRIFSKYE